MKIEAYVDACVRWTQDIPRVATQVIVAAWRVIDSEAVVQELSVTGKNQGEIIANAELAAILMAAKELSANLIYTDSSQALQMARKLVPELSINYLPRTNYHIRVVDFLNKSKHRGRGYVALNSNKPCRDWIDFVSKNTKKENMNGSEIIQKMQKGEMFSHYETISPDKAIAMLGLMPRNRKINKAQVKSFATLMREGKWDESHPQGLIFNKQGQLINGQHRLYAVIESGCKIRFYCTFNADDDCTINLDNGTRRTVDQTGQILGLETDKLSIAIARCMFIQIGQNVSTRNIDGNRVLEMYQAHQESILFAKQKKSTSGIIYAPIRAIIARAHYQTSNPESFAFGKVQKLIDFIEILDTGFSREDTDFPAVALRNAYLNNKARSLSGEKQKDVFAAKTVNAVSRYLEGSKSKTVSAAKTQLFRIPEDND